MFFACRSNAEAEFIPCGCPFRPDARLKPLSTTNSLAEIAGQLYGKELDKTQAQEIMRPHRIEVDPQWPIEKRSS